MQTNSVRGANAHAQKILHYENLLNEKLRGELQALHDERDSLHEKAAQYIQLRTNTQQVIDDKQKSLKMMVDLGNSFFMQAKVPDTTWIHVNVGLGFHAQLSLSEAVELCVRREAHYKTAAAALTERIARVKAHIKLVAAALDELTKGGTASVPLTTAAID